MKRYELEQHLLDKGFSRSKKSKSEKNTFIYWNPESPAFKVRLQGWAGKWFIIR